MRITPKLDILPEGQRLLWPHLREIPKNFVLYGGTAIALRFGHRQSVDFDFFTSKQGIDLQKTGEAIPFVAKYLLGAEKNAEVHVDFPLKIAGKHVRLTLFNDRDLIPGSVNPPDICEDNKIKIATPIDLMASKVLALHYRFTAKDLVDVAEMIKQDISLQHGLEAAYAIAGISRLGTSQLAFDRVQNALCSHKVAQTISSVHELKAKSEESAKILRQAADALDIKKVYSTHMKAKTCAERNASQERER